MPSSFSVISPAVNPTTSTIVQQEEEEEEQPCKFGRIQFKLDYNFDKTTLAVTVDKFMQMFFIWQANARTIIFFRYLNAKIYQLWMLVEHQIHMFEYG